MRGWGEEERVRRRACLPALQGIHKLPRRIQAFAHESSLLAHGEEGILEEAGLVFRLDRGSHCRAGQRPPESSLEFSSEAETKEGSKTVVVQYDRIGWRATNGSGKYELRCISGMTKPMGKLLASNCELLMLSF